MYLAATVRQLIHLIKGVLPVVKKTEKVGEDATSAAAVEYTRQVWLAGLGALSRANEEGGKLFESLVKEGEAVEGRSRDMLGAKASDVRNMATGVWEDFMKRASGSMGGVEQMFEEQVNKTLSALGVATDDDIKKLTKQVQELSKEVKSLNKAKTTRSSSASKTAKSSSAKK